MKPPSSRYLRRTLTYAALSLPMLPLAWYAASMVEPLPTYQASKTQRTQPFADFLAERLEQSRAEGVLEGNQERLIRYAPRTKLALMYTHGFGASRADGEYIVERLSRALQANTYFVRLPGHGSRMQNLTEHRYTDYLQTVEQAFSMLEELGEQRILIGTSLGGALSTYVASTQPDAVKALVLFSPFYDFEGIARLLNMPGGVAIGKLIAGRIRNAEQPPSMKPRIRPNYERHWYTHQYTSALHIVRDLKRYIAQPARFEQIRSPALMLYSAQDPVASVTAMNAAFDAFQSKAQSRRVAVEYGNHIMASAYVDTDKDTVLREAQTFLQQFADAQPQSAQAELPKAPAFPDR